jgi:imidazolonepropionase
MKADLIIHNSNLITCASGGKPKRGAEMLDVGLIENGAIAVRGGRISAVGKSFEILKDFQSENTLDANGKTVAPGFVECHTHVVFAGNRLDEFELKIKGADYLEILESGGGIISTVRQTRNASLAELIEQSQNRLDKMLAFGITTAEIKTGYGLTTETEMKMLEAIFELDKTHSIDLIPTFLAAHAIPSEFREKPDKYVQLICDEMLPIVSSKFKFKNSKKPFFVDVFCEKGAFNIEQSKKILEKAKSLGFNLKAHVDEFTNLGGARVAIELGATSIDHLDKISDDEIVLLANSDTIGVVTPTVNFNFGSKDFADARKMIDANCAIAVSTDYNPGSAPCPSLPNAMAIACRYQKLLPSEAFNAATINSAYAIASGDKIGSLEVGKRADVLIFDTKDYREIAYEFGSNLVEKVFKNGEVINSAFYAQISA